MKLGLYSLIRLTMGTKASSLPPLASRSHHFSLQLWFPASLIYGAQDLLDSDLFNDKESIYTSFYIDRHFYHYCHFDVDAEPQPNLGPDPGPKIQK